MPDSLKKSFSYRSLLTDTLPYEVPVIFSNDRFHANLAAPPTGPLAAALDRLLENHRGYSVPYNYAISKDKTRTTTLSIVHPLAQRSVSEFYELHGASMLSNCSRGRFSLRKPVALASPFAKEIRKDEERAKSGIPQLLTDAGEADMSHMSSYFAYGKYNLLGKFIASREYIRLESRYPLLRQVDISKCFYNIYTHSFTWSVKSKDFAKEQKDTYSFEAAFDKLMQKCNYNETNGIVVGPEFSRIFAEIILQDIDECIELELRSEGLRAGLEYDIRRYVDDYFLFSGDLVTLDRVEKCLRKHLERYKLYVNERKVETYSRPFVSPLTLARDEVAKTLREISSLLAGMSPGTDNAELQRSARGISARLHSIRLSVVRHDVQFANISGWLMSRLRRIVRRIIKVMPDHEEVRSRDHLGDVAITALETSLYLCSIDLRVRTTYSLCQLNLVFKSGESSFSPEQNDLIAHLISDHITGLIRYRMINKGTSFGSTDDVEFFNLLICGSHFVGEEFLTSETTKESFRKLLETENLTYFTYITLAFCMRKKALVFSSEIDTLLKKARERVLKDGVNILRDTEEYLFAIDYLTSPDVPLDDKQSFYKELFNQGNSLSYATLSSLGNHIGFADWTGVTVEHQLRRKELRPVYAWG